MPSIDERVVAMSFENQVFETRVAQTMATLTKLDNSLKTIGQNNGLQDIEKSADKVTLQQPMSALDKLKAKFGRGVTQEATDAFGNVERAADKVTLGGASTALDKLQGKMGQLSAGSTFTDIEKAADRTDLSGLSNALDNVKNKFSVLQGAAAVALGNIYAQAAMKGAAFAKSFAFGPISDGLHEYATNLNSIQTILANTQGQQITGLSNVNKYLNELNRYSDKTIYNFSEMAKNIGTFTAAGVDLKTSTASIKGIANLAALSGSNSQQASTAMYQLSQAIAAGRVGLQDWNSVVNAGMGGAVFQKALMRTAENMGTVAKGALKIDKATGKATINGQSFRESIMAAPGKTSWLTSDVLTKTLTQFTGDLSNAQLAAQGFNAEQIKAIQQTAKSAQQAATQVKTLPQVFDVARETIGSGWGQTFQLIFGNFNQAKTTFTALSNTINAFINRTSAARNNLLKAFDAMGGRDKLILAIKTAFSALAAAIKPVHDAFRTIFPPTTAKGLLSLVTGFQSLADAVRQFFVQHGGQLKDTFAGIFAVFHIGLSIVKGIAGLLLHLFGVVGKGSGGFLAITAAIGRFLTAVDAALTKGGGLNAVFTTLGSALEVPLRLLGVLAGAIGGLFGGGGGAKAQNFAQGLDAVAASSKPLSDALKFLSREWDKLVGVLDKVKTKAQPVLDQISNTLSNFGHTLSTAFSNIDWGNVFGAAQTGIVAGLFIMFRKALNSVASAIGSGGGVLKSLSGVFHALTGNLQVMQQNIKANILVKIAAAIGILAAAVVVLSQINAVALQRGMTALAVGMGEMVGALAILSKVTKGAGFFALPVMAASLVGLSTAMLILAGAVKIFSTMDWNGLMKGLVGVGGSLMAVGVGVKFIGPRIVPAALAMIPLAVGINLLALAVRQFGSMDLATLGKGLGGVGVALGIIGVAMKLMPPSMVVTGAGLIAVGFGLTTIAAAIASFGALNLKTMVQGILGVAGALLAIGMSVSAIPPTMALQAAGLVVLGAALIEIGTAIGIIGRLKIGTLVKGIVALAAVLMELSIGLTLMAATLPGSAALLIAAGALAVLGPALGFLGQLDFTTILKGLGALAAVLAVLAIAGATIAAPLAALGVALLPLAGVLAAVGVAAIAFGFALKLMGDNGVKAVAATIAALLLFASSLPKVVITFLQGLVSMVQEVIKIAPMLLAALGTLLGQVIGFVTSEAPKLAVAIGVLIGQFLSVVRANAPGIIATGFGLLMNFLSGISNNLPRILDTVATVIVKFLKGLKDHAPAIVTGGVSTLLSFLGGILSQLPRIIAGAARVVVTFLSSVASHIPEFVSAGVRLIVRFLDGVASKIGDVIKSGVGVIVKFIDGVANAIPRIAQSAFLLVRKFIFAVADKAADLADAGFRAVINFLHGIANAIRNNEGDLIDAGLDIAKAIVDGLVDGLGKVGHLVRGALMKLLDILPGFAKKILGIHSPSTVFAEIGVNVMRGLALGISDGGSEVHKTMEATAHQVIDSAAQAFSKVPGALDGLINTEPVITPVLDLSQVSKGAQQLSDLTNVTPITAAASYGQASTTSQEVSASQQASADAAAAAAPTFNFEQNNYSPEALDDVEIYRKTKNQLAQVKDGLGLAS